MPEPNTLQYEGDVKNKEREVTDPVTHLPLIIHDGDAAELERIPPPLDSSETKKANEIHGANSQEDSNVRHSEVETVVQETLHRNWWEDPHWQSTQDEDPYWPPYGSSSFAWCFWLTVFMVGCPQIIWNTWLCQQLDRSTAFAFR